MLWGGGAVRGCWPEPTPDGRGELGMGVRAGGPISCSLQRARKRDNLGVSVCLNSGDKDRMPPLTFAYGMGGPAPIETVTLTLHSLSGGPPEVAVDTFLLLGPSSCLPESLAHGHGQGQWALWLVGASRHLWSLWCPMGGAVYFSLGPQSPQGWGGVAASSAGSGATFLAFP